MATCVSFVPGPSKQKGSTEGGFLKRLLTYMVMDKLAVEPMSTISGITMLNKFNIKDVTSLEEKIIDMSMDKVFIYIRLILIV